MTSNSTPDYVPKRNANMCPHKDLHASVHSSILHDSPKVKTTHVALSHRELSDQ